MDLILLLFTPLIPFAFICFIYHGQTEIIKKIAVASSLIIFILSIRLYFLFDKTIEGMQFVKKITWIPELGIHFNIGVDGYSILLILTSSFVYCLAFVLLALSNIKKAKLLAIGLFWAQFCTFGVFLSLNGFLFYFFWELVIIPFYLFLGVYGSGQKRISTGIKFFTYTMLGSLCMLVAIIYLSVVHHNQFNVVHFNFSSWSQLSLTQNEQIWLFLAFTFSFLIKLPLMPFYTWQPDTYEQSPTISTLVLAGILSKLGIYGLYRLSVPLFPEAVVLFTDYLFYFALLSIILGAILALMQTNMKRMLAYSSLSHLGFLILALFSLNEEAISGLFLQTVNHSLIISGLIYCVYLIELRGKSVFISDYRGLFQILPQFSVIFILFVLSSISLPGLSSFAGELFILFGLFAKNKVIAILSLIGLVLGAVYMLWLVKNLFFGHGKLNQNFQPKDINFLEIVILVPTLIFILVIGVQPQLFYKHMQTTAQSYIADANKIAQKK